MGAAVELFPRNGIGEPMVGAAVDDQDVGAQLSGQLVRLTVRQGEEDGVVPGEGLRGRRLDQPVGQRQQMRLMQTQPLTGAAVRRQGADGDLGVAQEQAQHLTAGIATGTGHRHPVGHRFALLPPTRTDLGWDYTDHRMTIQHASTVDMTDDGMSPEEVQNMEVHVSDEQVVLANGVDICVDTFGDPDDPTVLLIAGMTSSMDWWEPEFCRRLAAAGRFVIRYDHRDTGRSVSYPPGSPGYSADDLVADAAGVLEALQCPSAHVVGISMGGALAQVLALSRPELVDSLTLISTSAGAGDADLPPISPELRDSFDNPRRSPTSPTAKPSSNTSWSPAGRMPPDRCRSTTRRSGWSPAALSIAPAASPPA